MRKTKIICTLGPSTDKDGVLEELIKEGMNVARFNFSHGLHDEQKGRIDKLKEIRTRLNKPVAALLGQSHEIDPATTAFPAGNSSELVSQSTQLLSGFVE